MISKFETHKNHIEAGDFIKFRYHGKDRKGTVVEAHWPRWFRVENSEGFRSYRYDTLDEENVVIYEV